MPERKAFSRKVTSRVGWVKVTRVLGTPEHKFFLQYYYSVVA
jgi:hypothetical protein